MFSRSWKEHLDHLDAVLSALHDQSLFCNIVKCEFALDSVRFLGHIVDGIRLRPDPEKIMVVRDWKEPNSVTGVRQFLGFTNYFRRFIEGYSFIARPLEELIGKNKRFSWNEECQAAFAIEALKKALISVPVLRLPDVSKPFRLVTDASNTALAGVLLQKDETEDWHPVAYTSRRLRPEERNYHANERETLAVIHALRVWRTNLFRPFEIITDNQAVTYLLSKKQLSGREARWLDLLADFDMTISHKPGRENIADPISRALLAAPDQLLNESQASATLATAIGEFCQDEATTKALFEDYATDAYFQTIITKLKEESNNSWKKRYFWSEDKGLFLMDDQVWRLCIPKGPLRLKFLRMYHQRCVYPVILVERELTHDCGVTFIGQNWPNQ